MSAKSRHKQHTRMQADAAVYHPKKNRCTRESGSHPPHIIPTRGDAKVCGAVQSEAQ